MTWWCEQIKTEVKQIGAITMTPTKQTPYCEYCEKRNCGCNLMEEYMSKQTHTPPPSPLPWRKIKNSLYYIGDTDFHGTEYFKVCGFNKSEDCEFVLNIVNNYPALVEALKDAERRIQDLTVDIYGSEDESYYTLEQIRAALKQIGE